MEIFTMPSEVVYLLDKYSFFVFIPAVLLGFFGLKMYKLILFLVGGSVGVFFTQYIALNYFSLTSIEALLIITGGILFGGVLFMTLDNYIWFIVGGTVGLYGAMFLATKIDFGVFTFPIYGLWLIGFGVLSYNFKNGFMILITTFTSLVMLFFAFADPVFDPMSDNLKIISLVIGLVVFPVVQYYSNLIAMKEEALKMNVGKAKKKKKVVEET
jgi:hypothetical protein